MTTIYMRNVPDKPLHRALTAPLRLNRLGAEIPAGFEWDGSSVPKIFQNIFPRHRHPIASCRHDWRCQHAQNAAERKEADRHFRDDVGATSWWITKQVGYGGVRLGALFGVGVRY